jgi:hypothetical protein
LRSEINVGDILIYGRSEVEIDNLIKQLKMTILLSTKKVQRRVISASRFKKYSQHIKLKQEGLTKRIIVALGLDLKYSTPIDTPAKSAALGRDIDGKVASRSIKYANVVGMLLNLGHSCPDISFATHQCAQYTHSLKTVTRRCP